MAIKRIIILLTLLYLTDSCVRDFTPVTNEYDEILIIDGYITDQPEINYVRLSVAFPLWKDRLPKGVLGCLVTIEDDLGRIHTLKASENYSFYETDPSVFRGEIGREYILKVKTTNEFGNYTYVSKPVRMNPVPPIDTLYYRKKRLESPNGGAVEGCDIFLDTHDPENKCRFYRWDYTETWEYHFPFNIKNKICWTSVKSENINIRNSSVLASNNIKGQPVVSIDNPADRLYIKYSVLVKQYSLNEEEFLYWERIKNAADKSGGLYDIVPAGIPNNLYCIEDPNRKILGYFGVSAVSSKRLFIKDTFMGAGPDMNYGACLKDTVTTNRPDTIPGFNSAVWVLEDHTRETPPYVIITRNNGCVYCEVRGTSIKPDFWDD